MHEREVVEEVALTQVLCGLWNQLAPEVACQIPSQVICTEQLPFHVRVPCRPRINGHAETMSLCGIGGVLVRRVQREVVRRWLAAVDILQKTFIELC